MFLKAGLGLPTPDLNEQNATTCLCKCILQFVDHRDEMLHSRVSRHFGQFYQKIIKFTTV